MRILTDRVALITVFIILINMFVCVCNAVTDKEVESAIDDGAATCNEVTKACGAGGDCGSCHAMIEKMVEDRLVCANRLKRDKAA